MAQIVQEGVSDSTKSDYLQNLYQHAQEGDKTALEELSRIAMGRNDLPQARDYIKKLESQEKNEG